MSGRFCQATALAIASVLATAFEAAAQAPAPERREPVPTTVQRALDNAGCHRLPSSRRASITKGHFVRSGQEDWAAVCVSGQSSFIYVVWGGTAQCPSALATRRGTTRTLRTRGRDTGNEIDRDTGNGIDHDGIEDAMDGAASAVHYCVNRSWVSITGTAPTR